MNALRSYKLMVILSFAGNICLFFCLIFYLKNSNSLTVGSLAKGMGVYYWSIDITPIDKATDTLYLDIADGDKIYSRKIGKLSEVAISPCFLFLLPEENYWRFSIVSNHKSVVSWKIEKELFNPIFWTCNVGDITDNTFFMKGSSKEIILDFSKLQKSEIGMKLIRKGSVKIKEKR